MFWQKKKISFDEIYQKYKKKVFYTAYRFSRNNADATEISQEIFLKIYQQINSLKNIDGISSWIYRISVNTSINFIKKSYKLKEVTSEDFEFSFTDKGYDKVDIKDYFERIFKELSPSEKAVIILREIEGYSYSEIADIMEIKKGTVMSRIFNARKKFKLISEILDSKRGEKIE